ncbi:threonine--tRNA ligase [Candidatus Berkelbacteria bacterium]|nr:threonine--tRNA ligase [Candidatus Berkelbacteria bacterium]
MQYEQSELYKIRHSAAHVLAMAVLEIDPDAKLAIGPPIENGFYYDFDLSKPISENDFPKLEKLMTKIIAKNSLVEHKKVKKADAILEAKNKQQNFKLELIENLPDEELNYYGIDWFWDLCKGPHVEKLSQIKAFKLLSVAGAYWRGDEKQPMLTRIYGTAFESQAELDEYLEKLEESKRRDHKKLGVQLDLFVFSELVGAGLPLWTPKGMQLREILDDFVWSLRQKHGYEKVEIPHITKKDLYERSGHWEKFKDELFTIETREGHQYALKPMNCPHHTQIFKRKMWSYRDLPQRYANTTMVYRDEQSGELSGLSRVISITQDDAHVFCRNDQVKEEMGKVWSIIEEFYKPVGFELEVRLSLSDPNQSEKYLGTKELWHSAEKSLKELVKERGKSAKIGLGEATFYGPKIDFLARDSLNRQWQVATIQLDMNLPQRFDLTYINSNGEKERPVMIHCAIMGSIERYISILIEHFAGDFPVWLAPVQVKVLPISEKTLEYAREVKNMLALEGIRVEIEESNDTLGKKIRSSELEKIPYLLIIGEKEQAEKTVTVRNRRSADQQNIAVKKFAESIKLEIRP